MKTLNKEHLENEIELTVNHTEVLYSTARHMDASDDKSVRKLAEEAVVVMQDNGVEIDNYLETVEIAVPVVVRVVREIQEA